MGHNVLYEYMPELDAEKGTVLANDVQDEQYRCDCGELRHGFGVHEDGLDVSNLLQTLGTFHSTLLEHDRGTAYGGIPLARPGDAGAAKRFYSH